MISGDYLANRPPKDVAVEKAIRWSDRCKSCDYLLIGLPESGICPECGEAYDAAEICLRGWAMGTHARIWNSTAKRAAGLALLAALRTVPLAMFLAMSWSTGAAKIVAVIYGLFYFMPFIRRQMSSTHPVVVCLARAGCRQIDDRSASFWMLSLYWMSDHFLVPFGSVAIVFLISQKAHWGHAQRFFLSVAASIVAAMWLASFYVTFYRQLRRYRASGVDDLRAFLYPVQRWDKLDWPLFKRIDMHTVQLQIGAGFRSKKRTVDAQLVCDEERLQALMEQLREWWAVSRQ